jgi:hypothetical protein
MRKFLLTFFLAFVGLFSIGQTAPVVDERVELLSIVVRMAGFQVYNDSSLMPYVKAFHQHFDRYQQHPVILLARQIRDSMGLGFDGVMSMAVHLSPPPALAPVVAFGDSVPARRWGREFGMRFAGLLQRFYADARCAEFFTAERPLYDSALRRYMAIYNLLDVGWYQRFACGVEAEYRVSNVFEWELVYVDGRVSGQELYVKL